ncbi:MAG TPA: 50S ribosomal protein L18 [Candidatus Paceibacterota bacterium]|nr:50S ribosomal protein L18 [Candidatus Paceibacterota bacterium]
MKTLNNYNLAKRKRLHKKIRTRVVGSEARPRLSVFRSNKFIYAQIIDDNTGKTLVSVSDIKAATGNKVDRARSMGEQIAELAKKSGITAVVFDRGGFRYTGRIAALADGAREKGLQF